MEYMIFDVETTGLTAHDEIVEFAGFLVDDDLRLKSLYLCYCDTLVSYNPEAVKITGLDRKLVHQLSKGKFFEDYFLQYTELWNKKDLTWVGYNVSFDIDKVKGTLQHNGYQYPDFGRKVVALENEHGRYNFDLMQAVANFKNHGRRMKLQQAVTRFCTKSEEQLKKEFDKIMQFADLQLAGGYHDAVFDAFVTYNLFKDISWALRVV